MNLNERRNKEVRSFLQPYALQLVESELQFARRGRRIWKITAQEGEFLLKQEPRPLKKALFIAAAHQYLQEAGLAMARLCHAADGRLCTGDEEKSFFLYEYHDGAPLSYYDRNHLRMAMRFKADFHNKSCGFIAPPESKTRKRIGKWEKLYRWKRDEINGFKLIAEQQKNDPFSSLFLQYFNEMNERARRSLAEVDTPWFRKHVEKQRARKVICEQDFTLSRLILKDGKPFMRELRSVNMDLPVRDIRMILNKVMKKMAIWDEGLAREMISAYHDVYPLSRDDFRALSVDLYFPHLFCSTAQNYYLHEKKAWSQEKYVLQLQKAIAVETSKPKTADGFAQFFPATAGEGGVSDGEESKRER